MEDNCNSNLFAVFNGEKEITEEMYQEVLSFINHVESK